MDIFIISDIDQDSDGKKYLRALIQIYDSMCMPYRVVGCINRDDIIQKTFYYATLSEVRYIFSIGSIKTLNGIINGMAISNKPLVVIPCNDSDLCHNLSLICKDTEIDLGVVNNEYFFSILSIGLDALISQKINIMSKRTSISYIKELLTYLRTFSSFELNFNQTFESVDRKIISASFYNGAYFGNTRVISNGSFTDGKLDLMMFNDSNRLKRYYEVLKFFLGIQTGNITFEQLDKAYLYFDYPTMYTYDGIVKYDSELNVGVAPKKILIKKDLDPKINGLCIPKK